MIVLIAILIVIICYWSIEKGNKTEKIANIVSVVSFLILDKFKHIFPQFGVLGFFVVGFVFIMFINIILIKKNFYDIFFRSIILSMIGFGGWSMLQIFLGIFYAH